MGQGSSFNESKSIILGNWAQMKPNSNIFFNKVTNQQIQRHEVVINNKKQLSSYAKRMQDQSSLICRLIYFHPKASSKDDNLKKQTSKIITNDNTVNNRPKSMLNEQKNYPFQGQKYPKLTTHSSQHENQSQIYCIYTDRMIPIKQWSKDKIIQVISAFKRLVQIYGLFKVKQRCICENERKQVKIWINQNPFSNFPFEFVVSQEDMIADFAAILVSKKQKIAKQLLDLQYFDQAIEHFLKLNDLDKKKYTNSSSSSNTASQRQSSFQLNGGKQNQSSGTLANPLEVNNTFNVFVNTDKSQTINSSMQNSKYNIISKANLGYYYFPSSSDTHEKEQKIQPNEKKAQKSSINFPQKYRTENDLNPNHQDVLIRGTQRRPPSHSQTPGFGSFSKEQQLNREISIVNMNEISQISNVNQISINKVIMDNKMKEMNQKKATPIIISPNNFNLKSKQQQQLAQNTSIMVNAQVDSRSYLMKTDDGYSGFKQQSLNEQIAKSQKKYPGSGMSNNSGFYFIQNPKSISSNLSKFIPSTSQDIKNRSKNNSSGDIKIKKNTQNQQAITNQSCIRIGKNDALINNISKENDKKFFSNDFKVPSSLINLKNQNPSFYNQHRFNQYKEKFVDQGRFSQGQSLKYQHQFLYQHKNSMQERLENQSPKFNQLSSNLHTQSKIFVKSGSKNDQSKLNSYLESNINIGSQMGALKPPNLMNQNYELSKKSFPKYFQEKQTTKSIQKYYKESIEQREKSKALIGKSQHSKSPYKFAKGFGQQQFQYKPSKIKDITEEIVTEVFESDACSEEVLPVSVHFSSSNGNFLKHNKQFDQSPRRKFPSTIQSKNARIFQKKSLEQKQVTKFKPKTEIDSKSNYVQSYEGTKSNFMDMMNDKIQQNDIELKKSNNTCVDYKQKKGKMINNSFFHNLNTNNSCLISTKQQNRSKVFGTDIKKRNNFESIIRTNQQKIKLQSKQRDKQDRQRIKVQPFNTQEEGSSNHKLSEQGNSNQSENSKQIYGLSEEMDRKQTFPHYQPFQNPRKNQKHFTFFNSTQKPSGFINIEQINPYESSNQKNRFYLNKKDNMKFIDEQESLPRTTADENQRRMLKANRTSEVLVEINDLHSSDPGHRIQQIVETLQRQKMINQTTIGIKQRNDLKQHQRFKKWEPSLNIYASLITPSQQISSARKKDHTAKSQKNKNSQITNKSTQMDEQKDEEEDISPNMVSSQNLQKKKNIRKQVLMDYKDLFGDQNPFEKSQTAEEKERAKRLEIKKIREEEQRLLQNASSKDLLIQQKVQKQKKKHAQLKNDLSKLFSEEF